MIRVIPKLMIKFNSDNQYYATRTELLCHLAIYSDDNNVNITLYNNVLTVNRSKKPPLKFIRRSK